MGHVPLELVVERVEEVNQHSRALAEGSDRDLGFPSAEIDLLGQLGFLAAPLGTSRAGAGLGLEPGTIRALLHVLRRIGHANLSVGRLYEGHVNALQLIQTYGTLEQAADLAESVHAGRLCGVWNSEDGVPGSGTRLRHGERGAVVSGAKVFASGAGFVSRALITATQPDGTRQMCLMAMDRLPVRVLTEFWRPLGMRASASHRVEFDDAVVGPDALIGGADDYIREPLFRGGAIRFAAVQAGGAEALLDACRDYLRTSGRADPFSKERLARAALAVEGNRLWLDSAADTYERYLAARCSPEQPRLGEVLVAYANMVRSAIERASMEVLELVERSVGARGLLRPHPVERIVRDLRMYLRQPASDATLVDIGERVLSDPTPVDRLWHPTKLRPEE